MRDIGIVLLILVSIFLFFGTATAMPQYYLFKGNVRAVGGDNISIAVNQGFKVGEPVEYLFMVDAYVMGQVIYSNGKIDYDNLDIYAELISGSILKEADGGYYLNNEGRATGNTISGYLSKELHLANIANDNQKQIIIGNEDEHMFISSSKDGSWIAYLQAYDSAGRKATVYLDLELTSVTSEIPFPYRKAASLLPESVAMVFLGTSLLILAGFVNRIRKRQTPRNVIPVSEH